MLTIHYQDLSWELTRASPLRAYGLGPLKQWACQPARPTSSGVTTPSAPSSDWVPSQFKQTLQHNLCSFSTHHCQGLSITQTSAPGFDHKIFLQEPPRSTILRNTYPMIAANTLFSKCTCNILYQSISPSRFWPAYRPAALRKPLQ